MAPFRILIADDHVLIREMVKRTLENVPDVKLVGETGDGFECLELVKRLKPDLLILDISMPGADGFMTLREVKNTGMETKVLVLTMHGSKQHISQALLAGADGYLLKENTPEDLIEAIKEIRQGGNYVSNLISNQVVELLREPRSGRETEKLTTREKEILDLMVSGKSSKEISGMLSISVMTIYSHCNRIRKKLGVRNDMDLALRMARERPALP